MAINSSEFLIFFVLLLAVYYLLSHRGQNYLLLAGSYFFYATWDWRFLGLLLTTTVVDYSAARLISQSEKGAARRFYLVASIVINLSILGCFKYFNFFVNNFSDLLRLLGLPASHSTLKILLPLGISFYTFKSMSYTIDVFRRQYPPTRHFLHYALFVAFFPQLVAGPIERAQKLIPQFEKARVLTTDFLAKGLLLILLGYLKKVVIADNLGLMVNQCFHSSDKMSSLSLLMGAYYYAFQIYCDFSGYTDVARGTANLLGLDLMVNFRQPYFSQTVREFWTRWHVSLSRWLRDYVYTPLSYRSRINRVGRSLFITMALCGLWHGASWNFVVWGVYFGFLQWIEWPLLVRRGEDFPSPPKSWRTVPASILRMALVFHLVCASWILFRAETFGQAYHYILRMFSGQGGVQVNPLGALLILMAVLIDLPQYLTKDQVVFLRLPNWVLGFGYAGILGLILLFGTAQPLPFIYARF